MIEEEAVVVAFRRISRLPDGEGDKARPSEVEGSTERKFRWDPIGYFHLGIAEVRAEKGKPCLFVAIDRTSKFAFVEAHKKAGRRVAADFLRRLAAAPHCKVHAVLTGNPVLSDCRRQAVEGGTRFTDPTGDGWTPKNSKAVRAQKPPLRRHAFESACADLYFSIA